MAVYWAKQNSSRPVKYQILAWAGTATPGSSVSVPSTAFGAGITQIRVVSEVQGWLAIGDGTAVTCTAQSASMKINGNVDEEYFTVTPGQMLAFNSTSTSSGMVSVTEMA